MQKSAKQPTERKKREPKVRALNLNLILWLSFLLFAIVLVILIALVQNFQLNRRYSEQIKKNLEEAAQNLQQRLEASDKLPMPEVSKILLSVTNEYNVSVYLFSGDGEIVFPDLPEEEEDFRSTISAIRSGVEKFIQEAKESGEEVDPSKIHAKIAEKNSAGYAFLATLGGEEHFVYLTSSLELLRRLSADMTWYSLITALFAVALSFVVSGFVSMLITKPVTEVTERAKELARGNYEGSNGKTYFCSELNELSKSLDYASSEIGKTDRMQKELIANVSHDFKTPLTMIKAYAAMIDEISGDDPAKRKAHTRIIMDEADRLAALVGDLLDLSRLQAGMDEIERTVFNLSEDVYAVAGRFQYLSETGYRLETDIDDDVYTYAGKARVEQVLYNLIGNAFQYTGEDKKVSVRLKKGENGARFEVQDSGKGIPPEEIDTIWERYYRSSETHKRPVQGTGLGLSIVKSVLLKYNIPFGVQSEEGKGSCFWVNFPLPPDERK